MEFANKGLDPTTGSIASIWSPASNRSYVPLYFSVPHTTRLAPTRTGRSSGTLIALVLHEKSRIITLWKTLFVVISVDYMMYICAFFLPSYHWSAFRSLAMPHSTVPHEEFTRRMQQAGTHTNIRLG